MEDTQREDQGENRGALYELCIQKTLLTLNLLLNQESAFKDKRYYKVAVNCKLVLTPMT